jgi:nitrate reductase gamma subunit
LLSQPIQLEILNMNMKTIVAALLVTVGIVVLAYSGITFSTPGKPVEFLGLRIQTTENHFIPPVAGALAVVGGIVLLLVRPRRA